MSKKGYFDNILALKPNYRECSDKIWDLNLGFCNNFGRNKKKNIIKENIDNNKKIFTGKEKADCISKYFCEAGSILSSKLLNNKRDNCKKYLTNRLSNSFYCADISINEII